MEVLRDFAPLIRAIERDFAHSDPLPGSSALAPGPSSVPAAAPSTCQVLRSGQSTSKPLPPLTVRLLHGRLLRLDLLGHLSYFLLRALSNSGLHLHAVSLHSLFPDPPHLTLPFALKSAYRLPNPLPVGEQLHARSLKLPSHSDPYVLTSFLNLYAKCGLLDHARAVLDEMRCPRTVSWAALIAAYVDAGRYKEAVATARDAFASGMRPDSFTAEQVLTACARAVDLDTGEAVWRMAEREGIATDLCVATAAVNLYTKCGEMAKAREVFEKMPKKDAVAWHAMVWGYASNVHPREALELLFAMQAQGLRPDWYEVAGVLSACTRLGRLDLGQQAAGLVDWDEFLDNPVLGTALIDMYAKCGSIWDAWFVFQQMRKRDIIVWKTMISELRMAGHGKLASALVGQMEKSGMQLNKMTSMSHLCSGTHNSAKATHSASANSPERCSVDMDGADMAVAPESVNTSPTPNGSAGGSGIRFENCDFKSRLYEYVQKAGLMMPKYRFLIEGPPHKPIFRCMVLINNVKYESLPGFFSWKAAQQSAAEVALMEIGKSVALPSNHETGLCRSLLEQYAGKMNYAIPSYICNKQASGVGPFICTVEIGGIKYIGATAHTKKEAELKAAQTALLAIQGQLEGCANGNTKYIVAPGKRQGKETEKKAIGTPKPLKANNGGFKKQWNQKKFIKKNDEAVDVERDEARVPGETHHSDLHMEPAETIQDPSIDTVMLQPDEGDGRVKHEPTRDTAILQSDGEGRKVEQEPPSGVMRFGGRAPWRSAFEKFKILILNIQKIGKQF